MLSHLVRLSTWDLDRSGPYPECEQTVIGDAIQRVRIPLCGRGAARSRSGAHAFVGLKPLSERIWDTPLAFVLILLVLTAEWIGRKVLRLA